MVFSVSDSRHGGSKHVWKFAGAHQAVVVYLASSVAEMHNVRSCSKLRNAFKWIWMLSLWHHVHLFENSHKYMEETIWLFRTKTMLPRQGWLGRYVSILKWEKNGYFSSSTKLFVSLAPMDLLTFCIIQHFPIQNDLFKNESWAQRNGGLIWLLKMLAKSLTLRWSNGYSLFRPSHSRRHGFRVRQAKSEVQDPVFYFHFLLLRASSGSFMTAVGGNVIYGETKPAAFLMRNIDAFPLHSHLWKNWLCLIHSCFFGPDARSSKFHRRLVGFYLIVPLTDWQCNSLLLEGKVT